MDVWKQPVRGVYGDLGVLALPGIDRFRLGFEGRIAPPPVHHLTGLEPTEATAGRCVFRLPASPWLRNPVGVFPLGVLAFVADAPLASVAITGLGPGEVVTTSQLSVRAVRPVDPSAGMLLAEAGVDHLGRLLAMSSGRVLDARGRLLATTSTRCIRAAWPLPDDVGAPQPPVVHDGPDPWQLPSTGALVDGDRLARSTGLQVMQALVTGELPPPPLHHLLGVRQVGAEEGLTRWVLPLSAWLSSGAPAAYGGALALFADIVLSGTCWSVVPLGATVYSLDLDVRFLRPVALGGELTAVGRVVHRGRTMVVAHVEVVDAAGKVVVVADGAAAVIPLDVGDLPLEDAMADQVEAG